LQRIPVFVVSLARAPERRAAITQQLEGIGVDFVMTDAVDGAAIAPEARRAMLAPGIDYPPGVVGCYLSHTNIYRRMVGDDVPVALVLEDDAVLSAAFVPVLQDGLRSADFDYCFLDYGSTNEQGDIYYDLDRPVPIHPDFTAYRLDSGPATTHAYLITKAAAAARLTHELPIRRPIDIYTTLPYAPRFTALVGRKAAWASETSLRSYISDRDQPASAVRFRFLRTSMLFYRARDLLSSDMLRRRLRVASLVRSGALPRDGRWRPLPPGRPLLY